MDFIRKVIIAVVVIVILSFVLEVFIFLFPLLLLWMGYVFIRNSFFRKPSTQYREETKRQQERYYNNQSDNNRSDVIDVEYTERTVEDED